MKQFPFQFKIISTAIATLCMTGSVQAGGFALNEQNASGAGVAYAGKAAIGEDASAAWFNPASMSRLKERQVVLGGHYIDLNGEVDRKSTRLNSSHDQSSYAVLCLKKKSGNGTAVKPAIVSNATAQ